MSATRLTTTPDGYTLGGCAKCARSIASACTPFIAHANGEMAPIHRPRLPRRWVMRLKEYGHPRYSASPILRSGLPPPRSDADARHARGFPSSLCVDDYARIGRGGLWCP